MATDPAAAAGMSRGDDWPAASSSLAEPPTSNSINEQDYRAIQRTFDGAYIRTALVQLCYALIILRLFQDQFYYIGLVYTFLALGFIPIAAYRYSHALQNTDGLFALSGGVSNAAAGPTVNGPQQPHANSTLLPSVDPDVVVATTAAAPLQSDVEQECRGLYRKVFVTAGSVVALTTVVIGAFEVALLVLVFGM